MKMEQEPLGRGGRATQLISALIIAMSITWAPPAHAHGEQIEVKGEGAQGPVQLTEVQQKAIGLRLVAADLRPLSEYLHVNGELQLLPGRQAEVSTRISGQVVALYAGLGDTVKAGQRVARVQARLVGDPPPSVDVTTPMSGVIDQRNAALGQAVEPNTTLFRISDRSQMNVIARVYEEDLGKVRKGQEARIVLLSYPDKVFTGKITLIGPTLDPGSRTVEAWAQLANPDSLLKPNMFAHVSLLLRKSEATLAIPTAAIIEANGEKFVFVHQDKQFARVEITTGMSDDEFTEVTDDLVPGDEVVTQGNRQLYTLWLTGGSSVAEHQGENKD